MYGSAGFSRRFPCRPPRRRAAAPRRGARGRPAAGAPSGCAPGRRRRGRAAASFSDAGTVRAKNESRRSGPGGGKTCDRLPAEERLDLAVGPADRRRRGDDLRPNRSVRRPRAVAEPVDGGLVEPDHRAERPGDEVQLVLDDQVGRQEPRLELRSPARVARPVEAVPVVPVHLPEERARRRPTHGRPRTCPRWR